MPWNNQGGGWQGGGGQGPWGGRPGGQQPPDLEELLRRSQEKVRKLFPGGAGGGPGGNRKALIAVPLILVAVWLASGFYRVQPDEQGVVLRFGEWTETTPAGPQLALPRADRDRPDAQGDALQPGRDRLSLGRRRRPHHAPRRARSRTRA